MNRKETIAEYKNRKTPRGTFVVRFAAEGPVWVDSTPDLHAAQNGLLYMLRNGMHTNEGLQAEWNAHGEASFRFEVLEKLPEDTPSLNLRDLLAERKQAWTEQSQA